MPNSTAAMVSWFLSAVPADAVELYVSPPARAVVLSVDEKSQIQAIDRAQPGLPMKKGRGATMTHDYKSHGTTTLFAALDVLEGTVFGRNMQRHRHQEFIRLLNALEGEIPAGSSTRFLTTTPHIKLQKCGAGWRVIRVGPSTSLQHQALG